MALLPLAAALIASGSAPNAVTSEGPATLRASWLGAVPAVLYPPRVVVRWSVQVGEGSAAGPVALRVITGTAHQREGKALARGREEQLPGAPGTYEFTARLRFLTGDAIGLDQEAGRHAIVAQHADGPEGANVDPFDYHALDLWRPRLANGATAGYGERVQGAQLLVRYELEPDIDADGYGDETQDANDLAISARAGRRAVRVVIRNRGRRTVAVPRVLLRMHGAWVDDPPRTPGQWGKVVPPLHVPVGLPAIRPGRSRSLLLRTTSSGFRWRLVADSEGFDPTPSSVVVRGRTR